MARTVQDSLERIRELRAANRVLYDKMKALIPDMTLELLAAAYLWDPREAKEIHREIIENDIHITVESRKLAGCE